MKNESATLKEVMDIRATIYEEIKDLPPDQQTTYFCEAAQRMEREWSTSAPPPSNAPEESNVALMEQPPRN